MFPIIGYGEDALTYWALRSGRLLQTLEQRPPQQSDLLLYRPSFGRRGGPNRAEFGEFDALIATNRRVYLIESKWAVTQCDGAIALEGHQLFRHQFFRHLRHEWRSQPEPAVSRTWATFRDWVRERRTNWDPQFREKPLASGPSRLASNLEWVLKRLDTYPSEVQDVLLHFHRTGTPGLVGVEAPDGFELRQLPYTPHEPIGQSGFFIMDEGNLT